ncbi:MULTISPECIES: PhoD-like phosphatase N-terminal domain-containing protein [unclassified Coleofasciculus]|uniref:PhoD-like phosphatase N-terminal domain-containing protein n=1 Tax=unclassified Coleofasciculus TaxID=2692782 RepID=UPI001881A518|nr:MULTISPECIES: PhoD-like phosphatase N-terminal domain-containing protein [unclassified Coleofasciculus]MBE9125005.1 PhoD-like phosphatase N-terminal domain-containing protein [Coleofasciculus sp. LEGE 07081]MBE9147675.1 PhoD-like phosphatase N-terminal domain-containing protein [Coleofasciculus sp. LEGE 07092]
MARRLKRRSFLALSLTGAGAVLSYKWLKPAVAQSHTLPIVSQVGDVTANSAIIWARGDRIYRLLVDLSTSANLDRAVQTVSGSQVSEESDFTGTVDVKGLRPNTTYYYQTYFDNNDNLRNPQKGAIALWSG